MRSRDGLHGLARDGLPGAHGHNVLGRQHLRHLVGLGIDQGDIRILHARLLQGILQQQVFHQALLHGDLFTLEVGHRLDAGLGHDHVVAVGVIGEHDHHALGATGTRDQRIAIGHRDRIDLAGRKGIHRSRVIEPLELHIDAGFLEPALVDRHLPGDPTRPVAIPHLQGRRSLRAKGTGHGGQGKQRLRQPAPHQIGGPA